MGEEWKRKLSIFLRGWGSSLLVAVLIATSFKSAIADWNDIPSGSMLPTILIGDRVFVNKLAYDLKIPYTTLQIVKWSEPKRGDIVVFFSPKDGKRLIKRVVGLPGDTIAMRNDRLFINGQSLRYGPPEKEIVDQIPPIEQSRYIFLSEKLPGKQHTVMFAPSRPFQDYFEPMTIPAEKYFMMGDNRDNSADSRVFGYVDRRLIVGRATMVVISREGSFLNPRWDRFFGDLS
jgi:signal peptidase I